MMAADCPHRPPCPGCPRFGDAAVPPRAREALRAWSAAHGGPEPAFETARGLGSRHRARLMVRGRTRVPKVGLFQAGSHRIVDIPRCAVHHPTINRVAAAVKEAAAGVTSYADAPHRGSLRAVQVAVASESGRAQIVLVENAREPGPVAAMAPALAQQLGDALLGLFWNGNPERTNTILGPHWQHLAGDALLWERVADGDVAYPPAAFGQSQPEVADAIARRVRACVTPGRRIVEFFAGTGALGLALLGAAASVHFVELNPAGAIGLQHALARRSAAERTRAEASTRAAEDCTDLLAEAEVVVLDPPRKGVHPAFLSALAVSPVQEVAWVSCGLDAFLAQATQLLATSSLRLTGLWAYPLLPFTEHVETVAHFRR
ncbi:MAG: hypothetical protein AAF430_22440 [Myxococcota bacterium]